MNHSNDLPVWTEHGRVIEQETSIWHFALVLVSLQIQVKNTLLIIVILATLPASGEERVPNPDPKRFAKSIAAFEKKDAEREPSEKLVLFVGSSSIRMWESLAEDFPERKTLNRGFGGSHISDALHYFETLVTRHKPAMIVLYAGENDLWSGKSPQQVLEDFNAFDKKVRETLPKTHIFYIACKPSPKRWGKWHVYQKCNRMIETQCAKDKRLTFVNVSKVMLGPDGKPRPDIWLTDKLHMNAVGYARWTTLIRSMLPSQ